MKRLVRNLPNLTLIHNLYDKNSGVTVLIFDEISPFFRESDSSLRGCFTMKMFWKMVCNEKMQRRKANQISSRISSLWEESSLAEGDYFFKKSVMIRLLAVTSFFFV